MDRVGAKPNGVVSNLHAFDLVVALIEALALRARGAVGETPARAVQGCARASRNQGAASEVR
jgi:hypothetical protein